MDNNSVESMINNIVSVVFRIHFYYVTNKDLEQDLKQEGFLKAYELLATGNYNPNKNLRTFIYTGVRNAMTNYMYHNKKESHEDLELVSNPIWQSYESITSDDFWNGKLFCTDDNEILDFNLDLELIDRICKKYIMFGDYKNTILLELNRLGLYNGHIDKSKIVEISFIKDAIIGEIFWNMFND